jgi:uncharacterized membrane protein
MFTPHILWLWSSGLVYLAVGLFVCRKELLADRGLDKWIALGPMFYAAPLACFGVQHFLDARAMQSMVPGWLPAHLFWVYFVGCAWIAGATSLVIRKYVRLSSTLLGVMFLLLVLTMDLVTAIKHPGDRLGWNFLLRESAFAGGAWALAGSLNPKRNWMVLFGRITMALACVYFGIEQLIYPQFTPGVPDEILTSASVPLHAFWGYPVGAILLLAGAALLFNYKARISAVSIGVVMTLLTVLLYLPLLLFTHEPSQLTQAIDFVADTLMFGGAALLVARALAGNIFNRGRISV